MACFRILSAAAALFGALVLSAAPAAAQQAISVGGETQGTLARGDTTRGGGEFVDTYTLAGRAGQRVQIAMNSSDLDSYLIITGPNGFSAQNDDDPGAGTLNSRLEVTLPADGQYRISASSFGAGATGRYVLRVTQMGAAASMQELARTSRPGEAPAGQRRGQGSITLGGSVSGELRRGDTQITSGEFTDLYTFEGRAGQEIDVRLESSEFDPYLIIGGPGGFQQDNDDDVESGTTNSRLVLALPQDGTYRLQVTSYAVGETGRYRLGVTAASGGAQAAAPQSGGRGAVLSPGQSVSGALAQGDAQLRSGEFVDVYRFLGQRGQRVAIDMQSSGFDTYLILRAPSGSQEDNDDGPNGTNARIETVLAEDGEYAISATSYQPGESGQYQLAVSALSDGERVVAEAPSGAAPSAGGGLTVGRAAQGALAAGDATLQSGEFLDEWSFTGRAGQTVTFDMSSTEIDSYLMVVSPSGEQQDNDDADPEAGVRDARVVWELPESGTYQLIATSYAPGETGAYSVRVTAGGAPAPNHPPVSAGRAGRVYAVFVGISDYAGLANNLPYTADDARNLAATLRADGVLAPESVVLTDGQATRSAVRSAFQRVAAAAGPDDLFLFFYSGHGSQSEPTSLSPEADRRDETIVLRDGEISDDEVAQWFGAVNARLAVIALDSCFSGGFARDVVNRPQVMGLFSSEEDLTSAIADKFRAGGYLSHFLRTGFDGEADENGDRSITAGELSTYLWRKFASEVENEEAWTSDRQRNYQRLVVDRGGVKIDDVVLAL